MIVTNPPRSKMTAALLAFFLGAIGAHRFYLGNNGMGMVMLLASVLSLGFLAPLIVLWSLIEMIIILTGGMRDAQGRVLA
jgi:TM2 domain-containing membrane protein YozV